MKFWDFFATESFRQMVSAGSERNQTQLTAGPQVKAKGNHPLTSLIHLFCVLEENEKKRPQKVARPICCL